LSPFVGDARDDCPGREGDVEKVKMRSGERALVTMCNPTTSTIEHRLTGCKSALISNWHASDYDRCRELGTETHNCRTGGEVKFVAALSVANRTWPVTLFPKSIGAAATGAVAAANHDCDLKQPDHPLSSV